MTNSRGVRIDWKRQWILRKTVGSHSLSSSFHDVTKWRRPRQSSFHRIASRTSQVAGKASTFIAAVMLVAVWAVTGPLFDFSETWQLIINTGTTIVTFLRSSYFTIRRTEMAPPYRQSSMS